jgi:arsenate reductase
MKYLSVLIGIALIGCGDSTAPKREAAVKPRIVFVCVENSNRSQMAEAFTRIHGGDRFEIYSAGSKPSGRVNPKAIAAMNEKNYDLSQHISKGLDALPNGEYAAAITMGCGDACPNLKAKFRDDWALPDPKQLKPEEFNKVRDEIEWRVKELLAKLSG